MDVYNIIRQLTDQEDVNSGQIKRECFDKLLPIKDYYKGWNFHKTDVRFNFLPNEDYHKERYEVKINVDDDVERVEKIEALNEDIDEYNDWVNEKKELQGKELLEKAPSNTVGAVEDLNLENKYYSTLGKHKPWLCTFQIEHPQFRKIKNAKEFGYLDDEEIYKLKEEMEIEEFVKRFNATLKEFKMSELNDIKVDNEEFWWEALDDFASDDEITVVEISRDDLDNNSTDGLKALGQVDMGEWDDLAEILNEKEANLHKEDFEMEELLYLVLLYCDGRYVTSIQADADDD